MKKTLLSFLLILFTLTIMGQTGNIKGTVSTTTNDPIEGAIVSVVGTNTMTKTDSEGKFTIENINTGTYQLGIFAPGFENLYFNDVKISNNSPTNIKITLHPQQNIDNEGTTIVNEDNLNETADENISSILHGSKDIFLDVTAYTLGPLRFRIRGYDNSYTNISINGADMSNAENGRTYWSNWGGLNNITRQKTITFGLDIAEHSFTNIGGSTDLQMIPTAFRRGLKITYSATNRSYRNRAMLTYSTGLLKNNWAFTISGSRRWANEGYVEGTFYDAWAYYIGIEKHLKKHTLILNILGAPIKRGKQGGSTQEAYNLVNNVYYNPYWGYQNGEKRNSRIAKSHQPIGILTHIWEINSTTKLNTTIALRTGRNGASRLNWYNAEDPRPDYYRFLPSYLTNPEDSALLADNFVKYSQIRWDKMYFANQNNNETITNVDGIEGNKYSGNRALYIVEETRYDQTYSTINSNITKTFSDKLKIIGGIEYKYFLGHNFVVMQDLLGADYWLDIDKYAERDLASTGGTQVTQSDLQHPNRIIKQGDIFGYNYQSHINEGKTWIQAIIDINKFNINLATFASYTSMWRYGNMENGKFPGKLSYKKSKTNNFIDYGAKTGIIFKINGRNFIHTHAAYITQAPTFRNTYISPRTRNATIENPVSEKIISADIGYTLQAPKLKASINAYYTQFKDQAKIMSFYHDGYRNFVNYAMTGINKTHQGIEIAIDATIFTGFSAFAVSSLGYYRYTSRPLVSVIIDNSAKILAKNKTVFAKNFLVEGTPQTVTSAGLKYKTSSYWFFSISANYFADRYLSFNPERRTAEAVEYIPQESKQWNDIIDQTKIDPAYTIDASIGKSFRFKYKYYLNINLNVNNILNDQTIMSGGYEQLRYDNQDKDPHKFPAKLFYLYGRQFYFNISFSF